MPVYAGIDVHRKRSLVTVDDAWRGARQPQRAGSADLAAGLRQPTCYPSRTRTDFMWSGGQADRQAPSDSAGGGRRAVAPQAAGPKAADASACSGSHGTSLSLYAAASGAITSQSCIKAALACSVLHRWHQARCKEH